MLGLPEDLNSIVNKYLLYLRSDKEILYSRQMERGRDNEAIEVVRGFWQEPKKLEEVCLHEIENNRGLDELYRGVDMFYEGLKD